MTVLINMPWFEQIQLLWFKLSDSCADEQTKPKDWLMIGFQIYIWKKKKKHHVLRVSDKNLKMTHWFCITAPPFGHLPSTWHFRLNKSSSVMWENLQLGPKSQMPDGETRTK